MKYRHKLMLPEKIAFIRDPVEKLDRQIDWESYLGNEISPHEAIAAYESLASELEGEMKAEALKRVAHYHTTNIDSVMYPINAMGSYLKAAEIYESIGESERATKYKKHAKEVCGTKLARKIRDEIKKHEGNDWNPRNNFGIEAMLSFLGREEYTQRYMELEAKRIELLREIGKSLSEEVDLGLLEMLGLGE